MYLNRPGQAFGAGHESAGVTAPATEWFLAEGATGTFFDLFLLIENPSSLRGRRAGRLLVAAGTVLTKTTRSRGRAGSPSTWMTSKSRPGLACGPSRNTPVAMRVFSTNAVPIIVERAMWWPQPIWYEAHNAPATTAAGTRWATAGGFAGGPTSAETYVLIANTGATAGTAQVSVYLEDGLSVGQRDRPAGPEPGQRAAQPDRTGAPRSALQCPRREPGRLASPDRRRAGHRTTALAA